MAKVTKVLTKVQKKYYTDVTLPDIFHGVIIRSPIGSGTIRSITHPNLPENYTIITARDIVGENKIITNNIESPILAYEKVSYVGEPIGILVGEDKIKLYELIDELEIKYTEAQENPEVIANKTNIIASRTTTFGESELLYTNSEIKIERSYASKLQFTKNKEPLGAICNFSKKHFTIYAPTQWPHHLRLGVCNVMGCAKTDITIIKTKTDNNATNSIWRTSLLACQTAIASKVVGRPVKIVLSRKEQDEYVDSPIIVHTSYKVALENDGTIKAMNADIQVDCGSFCPFAQEILDRLVIALSSIYRYKNFTITAYAQRTSKPPLSADLHLTDFLAFFSLENLFHEISRELHIFPNELRKKNIQINAKDKKNYPFVFDSQPLNELLDKVVEESDFIRKHVVYNLNSDINDFILPLKGIGLSCAFEGSGFYGANVNENNLIMEITMEVDGSVVIKSPSPPESIFEIWKDIICEILKVERDVIFMDENSTENLEPILPNITADNISILTNLLKKCCTALQKQRFRHPLPINVKKSVASNKNKKWNATNFTGIPFHSTSWVASVTEIEVNPCTYIPKILSIWIVISGGEILNKQRAELSVKKAIFQTLVQTIPGITYDEIPKHIYFIENKDEPKEIGDLVYNVLPASITNALSVAVNTDIPALPLLQDAIYYAMQKKEQEEISKDGEIKSDEN